MDQGNFIFYSCLVILFILFFMAGFLINGWIYNNSEWVCGNTKVKVGGVWIEDLKQLAKYEGRFICIRIDGSSLKDINAYCQHEVGHETFARICEKNITKCTDLEP